MEEKKKKRNIFSIITLVLMFLTIVFVYFGLIKANIVYVILSIICEISGIVLAIIGIVKATNLKKEIGKRKGIIISIISIIVILLVLIVSIMEFVILMYEQATGDTEWSSFVKETNLTEEEKIIGQGIKAIQEESGIGEFKVNDIEVYRGEGRFEAFIDYTFTSVTLGRKKERHKVLLHHIYSETNTGKPSSSVYEQGGNVYELISKVTSMNKEEKINVNKKRIIEYAESEGTKALNLN